MAFSLNETTLINAINSGNLFSVINSVISPGYGIYLSNGSAKAINPTSFLGVDYGNDASIASSPLEQGSYTSYNKVRRPPILRVAFVLEGWTGLSGAVPNLTNFTLESRTSMLAMLDAMVAGHQLYDIETPDTTYEDYDLVRYNYRTSSQEVTLLIVEAIFQAVLETADVTLSNANAKNNPQQGKPGKGEGQPQKIQSSVEPSTIDDVKGALTGLKNSVSSAATNVATSVSSAVNSVTSPATTAINGAATSSINNLAKSVTELVKGLT